MGAASFQIAAPFLFNFATMSIQVQWNRNSSAALMALSVVLLVNIYLACVTQIPAGGQDSWNHYLYARWSPQHPSLLLDQWGKPFFTLLALPFAQLGINGVLLLNHLCILSAAWLTYLTARKLGFKNPWMSIFLFAWQPIVLANAHSALTEPSNALVLVLVCYLFAGSRWKAATLVASFLPIVRSEGFVLLAGVMVFLIFRNRWKYLPLTCVGVFLYAVVGGFISGQWNWLLVNNPYIKQEIDGGFDAGHGSFWHYILHQREITGFVVSVFFVISLLLIFGYVKKRLQHKTPANHSQMALWLWLPLYGFFLIAHSILWWKGAMGSHGLLRVFVTVSPVVALLCMYALDHLMRLEIRMLNRALKGLISFGMFALAFPGAGFRYPWQGQTQQKGVYNGEKAGDEGNPVAMALGWIANSEHSEQVIAHQIPAVNVFQGFDPWLAEFQLHPVRPNGEVSLPKPVLEWPREAKTLSLWSLSAKDSGKQDWFPKGTVLLWDDFHGRRDGQLNRSQLRGLKKYKMIYQAGLNDLDSSNDVWVLYKYMD